MRRKQDVPAAVVAALRAWSRADPDEAAVTLERAAAGLSSIERARLAREAGEVTALQWLLLLDSPATSAPAKVQGVHEPLEVFGMVLTPTQAARTAQWIDELPATGRALGLSPDEWHGLVVAGFRTLAAELSADDPRRARAEGAAFEMGRSTAAGFTGGADPRTSERAGLRGVLGARAFGKKDS